MNDIDIVHSSNAIPKLLHEILQTIGIGDPALDVSFHSDTHNFLQVEPMGIII